ncbi:MAG: SDR family oxidoreductase [bacterium]|jgi:NAD(P)-dependent dehydrogenase (short-subunit alcohol dehydrogenase family)
MIGANDGQGCFMGREPGRHDPREQEPKVPFPEQEQPQPGFEGAMRPRADHGEETYRGTGKLEGRAALITGADSGIGRAVAIAFAREGADVLISYLKEHEDAAETARWVREVGRKAVTIAGDIGENSHCERLVEEAFSHFGRLDILVNNAAYQETHEDIQEFTPEEWEYTFCTNIHSMFFLSRAALPRMRAGSVIINTTSVQAYNPSPALLAYATTKGAIVTFTQALAGLAAKQGIRVNAVAPGPVWTPLIPASFEAEHMKQFGANTLIGRPAQPAELAPAYVYLASHDSSYVTGSVMDLTGGRMLP